jgi:hypothetical protein
VLKLRLDFFCTKVRDITEILRVSIQNYGEWCGAAAGRLSMCQITAEVPLAFSNNFFS